METALDVAVIDDFVGRSLALGVGPVADVGCGPGRVTAHLHARGVNVFGIDLSAGMIRVARREHPNQTFDVGSMTRLYLPDGHLGGLLAWYSIIHTPPAELPQVFMEFQRVLAPGAPLLLGFQAGHGERVDRDQAYGRSVTLTNYRFDPDSLAELLDAAGLDVRVRVVRDAHGLERTPQAMLLARRPTASGDLA